MGFVQGLETGQSQPYAHLSNDAFNAVSSIGPSKNTVTCIDSRQSKFREFLGKIYWVRFQTTIGDCQQYSLELLKSFKTLGQMISTVS